MKQILKTKAFYRLMPVLATIMLSSCSKDDPEPALPIEGTWKLISIMVSGKVFQPGSIGLEYYIITFSSFNGLSFALEAKAIGSDAPDLEYGAYTLSGKSLSIYEPGGAVTYWTIKSITENQLILVDNMDDSIKQTWTFTRVN